MFYVISASLYVHVPVIRSTVIPPNHESPWSRPLIVGSILRWFYCSNFEIIQNWHVTFGHLTNSFYAWRSYHGVTLPMLKQYHGFTLHISGTICTYTQVLQYTYACGNAYTGKSINCGTCDISPPLRQSNIVLHTGIVQ